MANRETIFKSIVGVVDGQIDEMEDSLESETWDEFDTEYREDSRGVEEFRAELHGWRVIRRLMELSDAIDPDKIINATNLVVLNTDKA